MLSPALVSLFATIGAMAWIYSKVIRSTGGNTKTAITTTVVSGVIIYIVVFLIFNYLASLV